MFLDDPNPEHSFTLESWNNCMAFYLAVSQEPDIEEALRWACKHRARYAAENVRRVVREIEDWEFAWDLPAYENDYLKIRG